MKKIILIILFSCGIIITNAQNRQTSVSSDFNVGRIQIQEDALNSLVHKGSLLVTRLSFTNESVTGLSHRIELSYGIGSLKSRFEENDNSTYWNPRLSYTLTKAITKSFLIGGYLSADYRVLEFENWDDSHLYWTTSYQFGPVFKVNNIPIKDLLFELSFPILAVVSRSRNEISNKVDSGKFGDIWNLLHSNTAVISFVKYRVFDFNLRYNIINSQNINLDVRSSFYYVHSVISNTKEFTSTTIVLGFLFTYKFN